MAGIAKYFSAYLTGKATFTSTLAVLVVGSVLASLIPEVDADPRRWAAIVTLPVVAFLLLLGAQRAADRMTVDGSGPQAAWAIYSAAAVLILTVGTRMLSLLLPASAVLPPIDTRPPKVVMENGEIHITGDIDYRVLTELRPLIETATAPKTIVIESPGGLVIAGRSIGLAIEKAGFDTRVDGTCYSACILVFAGGTKRRLGPDGKLGFHSYRFRSDYRTPFDDAAEEIVKSRAFLIKRGFSAIFIDQVFLVDPTDIWVPSRAELKAVGVLTDLD